MAYSILSPAKISYIVSMCAQVDCGNSKRYPGITDWNTSLENRFANWHYYRIWAILDGTASVKTTNGDFILETGKVYYIPACSLISSTCEDKMTQLYVDFLPISVFDSIDSMYSFTYVSKKFDFITQLMRELQNVYLKNDESSLFATNSIMSAILSCFYQGSKKPTASIELFKPVVSYIDKHYDSPLTVKELSALIGYTPEYFSTLFKQTFNCSPKQYLQRKRFTIAKTLLMTTKYSIGEIGAKVGYEDQMYFSRAFQAITGLSPSEFRKSFSANQESLPPPL